MKLLLHTCCAPCSTYVINVLKKDYDICLFFYNPNLFPYKEFEKRYENAKIVCNKFGLELIVPEQNEKEFLDYVKGFEEEEEGGKRCESCFKLRLKKTAKFAKDNNFDAFTTTLTISPHKNEGVVNKIGKELEQEYSVKFLVEDFKKNQGFLNSVKISKKLGLYRQKYCGCRFSLNK